MVVRVKKKAKLLCVVSQLVERFRGLSLRAGSHFPQEKKNTYSLPTACGLETVAW